MSISTKSSTDPEPDLSGESESATSVVCTGAESGTVQEPILIGKLESTQVASCDITVSTKCNTDPELDLSSKLE